MSTIVYEMRKSSHHRPAFTSYLATTSLPCRRVISICKNPPQANPPRKSRHRATFHMSTAVNPDLTNISSPKSHHPTKICTSLTAATVAGQIAELATAHAAGADLAEIRIDLLHPDEQSNWTAILENRQIPVIVTNRAAWEGGRATADEPSRLAVIVQAVTLGADYVDVELKAASDFASLCSEKGVDLASCDTKLILSYHDFEKALSLEEIRALQDEMRTARADICKIAMMAISALDNDVVFSALKQATMPTIVLAMGEMGQVSRIAAGKYGAFLTFASVGAGRESAPGQVDTKTLLDMYRFRDITSSTPMFGVIGNPVSHSMSPALHNDALALTGTPGAYVPLKVDSNIPEFIRAMSQHGFEGFSVTIPGKVDAIAAMDEMDSVAERIGAMNTVVRRADGSLKGYNTDWVAAISAVEEQVQGGLQGKHVLCIGAGGAGRALAFGALQRGAAHVTVANRTAGKAEDLANELGERASGVGLSELQENGARFDVILNSTAVGMHPRTDDTPVHKELFKKGVVVFDAVYNPLETRMLREAAEAGCVTVSGLEMFVRQAAEQFRLWFPEVDAPVGRMREVVLQRLGH